MKIVFLYPLFILLNCAILFGEESKGEKLFMEKCASCHMLQKPEGQKLKTPTLGMVLYNISQALDDDEEDIIDHIKEFTLEPDTETALCGPGVKKFGLMPSQKGKVTEKELNLIAKWMVSEF